LKYQEGCSWEHLFKYQFFEMCIMNDFFVIAMLNFGSIILPRSSEWTNPRHNNHLHLQGLSLTFNKDEWYEIYICFIFNSF
jgi:hypothetical protein